MSDTNLSISYSKVFINFSKDLQNSYCISYKSANLATYRQLNYKNMKNTEGLLMYYSFVFAIVPNTVTFLLWLLDKVLSDPSLSIVHSHHFFYQASARVPEQFSKHICI